MSPGEPERAGRLRTTGPRPGMARRSRAGAPIVRPDDAPGPGTARGRRRARALAGAFGGVLVAVLPLADVLAQQRIGRLFSTLEQRIELDRIRVTPVAAEALPEPPSANERRLPAVAVTVDGVVLRSDGHRLAWVNGVETTASGIDAHHTPDGRLRIRLPDGRTSTILKPGQTIDVNSRVRDAYEHRANDGAVRASGDLAGELRTDEAAGDVGGHDEPLESVGSRSFPAGVVQNPLRGTRAAFAPPRTAESATRPAGERSPAASDPTGRKRGK